MNDTQKEVSKEQEVQEPVRKGKPTRSTTKTISSIPPASRTKNGMKHKVPKGKGTPTSKRKKAPTGPSPVDWKLEMRELREEIRDNQKKDMIVMIAAMEKRNQTPPPVDVVAASLNKDNVSLLTGSRKGVGSQVSENSWKTFQHHEKQLTQSLKKYIRTNFYGKMKFTIEARESVMCTMAVDSNVVALHDPSTKEEFAAYFKKKVPQIFNQLRHNAQSLARRNWIGKNFVHQ